MSRGTWIIYRADCTVSNRSYFGLTKCGVTRRWKQHLQRARHGISHIVLHRAIRLHGAESFRVYSVYEAVDLREAIAVERGMIAAYGTLVPDGYNLTTGGEAGPGGRFSQEVRDRMKCCTPERRARIRAAAMTRPPVTDETKRKISAAAKARAARPGAGMHGKRHNSATKGKMRAAKLGKPRPPVTSILIAITGWTEILARPDSDIVGVRKHGNRWRFRVKGPSGLVLRSFESRDEAVFNYRRVVSDCLCEAKLLLV